MAKRLHLRDLFKKLLSYALAVSLAAPAAANLPINIIEAYADACTKEHNWTGLKFTWTDIPATDGKNMRWPHKTFFVDGDGNYKNFANHYVFCIANHTNGQVGHGTEALCVQNMTVADYNKFKGLGEHVEGADNQKFAFCLAAASAMWSYQRTNADDLYSRTSGLCAYAFPHAMFVTIEGRINPGGSKDSPNIFKSKADKEGSYAAFMNVLSYEFGLNAPTEQNKMLVPELKAELLANSRQFF